MRIRKGIAVMLSALLLVLAGCQSVGGVDIAGVMTRSAEVTSSESKSTLSIKFDVNEKAKLTEEDKQMFTLINGLQLDLNTKAQSSEQVSMNGNLKMGGKSLPFQLSLDKEQLAFNVEGAKKPFVLPLTADEDLDEFASLQLDNAEMVKLQKTFVKFFTKHAPNPKVTTVTSVMEPIFGQNESLKKIHMEFGADESFGWVRDFMKSMIADEQGTKAFFAEIGKLYGPLYEELMYDESSIMKDGEVFSVIAYKWLKENGIKMLDELETGWKEMTKESPELAVILSDKTKLKLDMYVDGALNTKKTNVEFNIALPEMEEIPLKGISFQAVSEMININQPVTIDKVDTKNAINMAEDTLTPGQMLRNFEKDSLAYELLINAGITSKYIVLPITDDPYGDWLYEGPAPYVTNGTTMVPLRYVAEQFDADVKWDGALKQVRIVDDITGSVIVLTINSSQATVDGVAKKLQGAPVLKDGTTVYVPLRSIGELLGAKVGFEPGGDVDYVILERK
ncbi:copper amine oxidase N-terminal domain-containing protein [Paenibacillus marinisediminis]